VILFNAEHHYVQISDTERHPDVERADINSFIPLRKVWLSLGQYSGYLGIYCTVFYSKWMKIVENTGKSPFMSSTKAILSPRRFSGNSKLPNGIKCRFSMPNFSQIGQKTEKEGEEIH